MCFLQQIIVQLTFPYPADLNISCSPTQTMLTFIDPAHPLRPLSPSQSLVAFLEPGHLF